MLLIYRDKFVWPTLHIELVGDPEVILQGWVADHTGECLALDVSRGLPYVADLCAGCAVDIIKKLHLWLAEEVGLPRHFGRGPSSFCDTGGHHSFIATVDQGSGTSRHIDLWLHCITQRK